MTTGPIWLAGGFAIAMLGIAVYCVGRLFVARRTGRPTHRDVDAVHVGMGIAMAGMLVPSLNPFAGHAWDLGWTLFFGLAVCWFGARLFVALAEGGRTGSTPAHLLSSGVMLYMMWPGSRMAMPGMPGTVTTPILTLVILGLLGGFAVLATDNVLRPVVVAQGASAPLAPRASDCCHIAMSVTMGYMLLLML